MADTLSSFIAEAKRSRFSVVPNLSETDIITIWESVSDFVKKQMLQRKGVAIAGLGVFTFSQKKIDVGSNKYIFIQRPVFVLSEKFVQTHSLRYPKQHTSGQIPIVPLNFTVLSNDTPFDRNTVEMCIKELFQAMSRCLATNRNIQFEFCSIGRLLIRDSKVKMRFFRDFITSLDSSGEMESAFRPDTANSVLSIMSNPATPNGGGGASSTFNKLVLPKIVEANDTDSLSLQCTAPQKDTSGSNGNNAKLNSEKDKLDSKLVGNSPTKLVEGEEVDKGVTKVDATVSESGKFSERSSSSRQLVPKPAALFDIGELRMSQPSVASESPSKKGSVEFQCSSRPSTCSHSASAGQELCYLCHQRALKNVFVDLSEERKMREKEADKMLQEYQKKKDIIAQFKEQAVKEKNVQHNRNMASFNLGAAQRLKAKQSVKSSEFQPSYVFQERPLTPSRHLKQADYCSQLDNQVKYLHTQAKETKEREEKMEREEQIELAKELAAYQESYIKEKVAKIAQHRKALAEQIAIKHELSSILRQGSLSNTFNGPTTVSIARSEMAVPASQLSGKLRPLSIPKPTIILPFSHTKPMTFVKNSGMKMVRMKPTSLVPLDTKAVSHQPVFGVQDASTEKRKEQEKREKELFAEQLKMVADKQRQMKWKAQMEQSEEAEMLRQTRQDLIKDIHSERQAKLQMRKALESSWKDSIKEKQHKLMDELKYSQEQGMLLHQQCEKYHRCKQCQRRRENHGESNLLYESRYISGSRLMV